MTAAQFEDAEGRALVEAIHQRKAERDKPVIPDEAVEAAIKAMETVTPPPGVDRADWLKKHGRYALLAGAIAAAAPIIQTQALRDAADEIDRLRRIGATPYRECTEEERRAWYDFAEVRPEAWLRVRAAAPESDQ